MNMVTSLDISPRLHVSMVNKLNIHRSSARLKEKEEIMGKWLRKKPKKNKTKMMPQHLPIHLKCCKIMKNKNREEKSLAQINKIQVEKNKELDQEDGEVNEIKPMSEKELEQLGFDSQPKSPKVEKVEGGSAITGFITWNRMQTIIWVDKGSIQEIKNHRKKGHPPKKQFEN